MKRILFRALCALATLTAGAIDAAATTVEFDGRERSFEMYVPATAPRPLPVVLLLHGSKGTTAQMRRYTDFDTLAAREGILAVYPQGVGGQWNDGRPEIGNIDRRAADTDDVAFLLDLVDTLTSRGLADPKRIYVAGIANGGMMAMRLACEHPGRLAGVAVVAANMPVSIDCAAETPVPILFVHGTNDRFVPFGGGELLQWANIDRGKVLSARETVVRWRDINGCSGAPKKFRVSEGIRPGSPVADRITYDPCQGAAVEHLVIKGGGHAWPGARQSRAGDALLGSANVGVDANEEIWSFFKAQPTR